MNGRITVAMNSTMSHDGREKYLFVLGNHHASGTGEKPPSKAP
jgi:hypothetical protein